jgi:hypothetical protein
MGDVSLRYHFFAAQESNNDWVLSSGIIKMKVTRRFGETYRFHVQSRMSQARNQQNWSTCWFVAWLILPPWRRRRYYPPKGKKLAADRGDLLVVCFLLVCLRPWRCRQHVPPTSRLTFIGLHGIVSRKTKTLPWRHKSLLQTMGNVPGRSYHLGVKISYYWLRNVYLTMYQVTNVNMYCRFNGHQKINVSIDSSLFKNCDTSPLSSRMWHVTKSLNNIQYVWPTHFGTRCDQYNVNVFILVMRFIEKHAVKYVVLSIHCKKGK